MTTQPTIPELLDAANSSDLAVAGQACRDLLKRHTECRDHIDGLIDLLQNPNAAIADCAFRTLERIGQPAVKPLVHTYDDSQGDFRRLLLGLIAGIASLADYYPLLKSEIDTGERECRYWAANCLGRKYSSDVAWPPEALELLDSAISILRSLQNDPQHGAQARMTLKHLDKLPNA